MTTSFQIDESELATVAHRSRNQLCTFQLENHHFCVDAIRVQEVIRFQSMTPVPLTENYVRGLINLRGQIVTAIDLRKRLGFDDLPDGTQPMNVVVKSRGGPVSLLVDRIGDVTELDTTDYEEAPPTLTRPLRDYIIGAYKLDSQLLLDLDIDALVGT
ncbi:MAG TPA: chemotaxis protein CheW [Planctomycetaceae bacterium]|nr:chemotaxis protein CheW [Planctomycetaceae bacterium]